MTFQTGKGRDHLVPVFFPKVTHKALEYLVRGEVRDNANVSKENEYIFANTQQSKQYSNGWHCLNQMLTKIFKKGAFNATKNRHRVASILARFNLNEEEKQLVYEHFGHSGKMNQDVYQTAAGSRQIKTTGKMLLEVRIRKSILLLCYLFLRIFRNEKYLFFNKYPSFTIFQYFS